MEMEMEMERERGHFRKNSSGSELFICLSSSSSMKLSKSILSPGHRLRPNKASPFFPKKRLDNPEPSSPKVTCIGQVRVKTKKKKKKKKKGNRSRRAEVSFRKIERSQGWVHLPVSICDALRTCFSVEGKRREIELVVGGGYEDEDEDEDEEESRISVRRRHVLEDIVVEEEAARVSICIPPKNALLLMRCRSDPMKMAALTNRFQIQQIKEDDLEITEDKVVEEEESNFVDQLEDCCPIQVEDHLAPSIEQDQQQVEPAAVMEEEAELNEDEDKGEEEDESNIILNESIEDEKDGDEDEEKEQESSITLKDSILLDKEQQNEVLVMPAKEKHLVLEDEGELKEESTILLNNEDKDDDKQEEREKEKPLLPKEEDEEQESSIATLKESVLINKQQNEEELVISPSLPECLVLMMREPKLSMEVSRETWVCSTDFRWRPKPRCDQKRLSFDSKAKRIQPPCSLASIMQKKLANEPLVLTRCNSEPVRVAPAKPDSCFWNNLEPRPQGVGV